MIKKTFGKALTTSYQDIYTVPDGKRAEWRVLFITDTAGSTISVDVQFYDASETATLQVLSSYSLGSNEFLPMFFLPYIRYLMDNASVIVSQYLS